MARALHTLPAHSVVGYAQGRLSDMAQLLERTAWEALTSFGAVYESSKKPQQLLPPFFWELCLHWGRCPLAEQGCCCACGWLCSSLIHIQTADLMSCLAAYLPHHHGLDWWSGLLAEPSDHHRTCPARVLQCFTSRRRGCCLCPSCWLLAHFALWSSLLLLLLNASLLSSVK